MKNLIWDILENNTNKKITVIFNNVMILIISLNIVAFILETEIKFYENYRIYFYWFEIFSIAIFTIEYILRMYSCNSDEKFKGRYG